MLIGGFTSFVSNAGYIDNSTWTRLLQHVQEQNGQEEMAQMIDSKLGFIAILSEAFRAHHHS